MKLGVCILVFFISNFTAKTTLGQVLLPLKKEKVRVGFWNGIRHNTKYDSLIAGIPQKNSAIKPKLNPAYRIKTQLTTLENKDILDAAGLIPSAYPISAGLYFNSKPPIISLNALELALTYFKLNGDVRAEALITDYYGTYYGTQKNTEKSISYLKRAYILNDSLNDLYGMAKVSFKLAQMYQFKKNFDQASIHTSEVIRLAEGTVNFKQLASAYLLMGEISTAQKKYSAAENYLLKMALPIFYYKLKDKTGTMNSYRLLAKLYQQQKRMSEAKWFFIQENTMARNINHPSGIIFSLVNLAQVKTAIGDYSLAIRDYKEAEKISTKMNLLSKRTEIREGLKDAYLKMNTKKVSPKVIVVSTQSKDGQISKNKIATIEVLP